MLEEQEFQQRVQKIEGLVHKIETLSDPVARAATIELMQSLMDLHGAGLERLLEIIWEAGEAGRHILDGVARDEMVGGMLILYGLHPLDLETRVRQTLDTVRPFLLSHNATVDLVGLDETGVWLRLTGSFQGCGSSAQSMKAAIEEALYKAAPDVTALHIQEVAEPQAVNGFVPLDKLRGRNGGSVVQSSLQTAAKRST